MYIWKKVFLCSRLSIGLGGHNWELVPQETHSFKTKIDFVCSAKSAKVQMLALA